MENTTDEILIDPNDFKSMVIKIDLLNITTQAEIRDGKRCYGKNVGKNPGEKEEEGSLEILISEFLENGLTLEIPSKTCAGNHTITIEIHTENSVPLVHCKVNLKVNTVERLSPESDLVETTFLQKDEKEWTAFQDLLNRKQEEIRNFLNAVKGYEIA